MEGRPITIERVQRIGPDGIAVELTAPESFDAAPGQFINITADVDGEEVSRVYTISSPDVQNTFEITVGVDHDGTLSPWLADADAGTTVELSGPYGNAYYEGESEVLVLAGGPGIGPAIAIAERVTKEDGRPTVIYRDETPFHHDRLRELDENGASVRILDADDPLENSVNQTYGENPDQQVFIYGFDEFVTDAETAIAAVDGELGAAKVENFG